MRLLSTILLACTFLLTSCTTVNVTDPVAASKPAASPSTPQKPAKPASPFKKWSEVLKDTRAMKGQFNLHLKRDQTLFMEIQPDQIGEDFGFISHFSKGTGVFDIHDGLYLTDTRLMRFNRVGDTVYLHHVNNRFRADEGTPMQNSLDDNVGHSIIGAFKIESQHDSTKALLINFTSFIVSDYMKLTTRIRPYFANRPVQFDRTRSYVSGAMAFPENVEIDAMLTFKPNGNSVTSSAGVSDVASIPVGVRYSFFALPANPMAARTADDRVGYFMDASRDFSNDKSLDQMVRVINRWRLVKADPTAEVSDPVKPIVYYIDRSVPDEYRKWIKEGIEGWQKAYEAAGFSNAIIAKDAPDDSTWSAEDMRYSTVRWSAAHQMGYAIGPSQTDPRTGEILNADILLSSTFMLGWTNEWQQLVGDEGILTKMNKMDEQIALMTPSERERLCLVEFGKQHQMGMLRATLMADGIMDPIGEVPAEFYGPALRDLVFHEVGHTLGLRHNFRGSGAIDYDRMQDTDYTLENGLTLSVMDYAGTNINPDRDNQGHYVNEEVGAYDIWAISFGYTTDDADAEALARQSANPMHAYNTDGDTHLGPLGIDPLSNTWDLSSDPIAYARDQQQLSRQILPVVEDRLVGSGDSYSRLRGALNGLLFNHISQMGSVAKMVGGSHFSRDHKGDPDGRVPFTPVSGAEQREAVAFILETVMSLPDAVPSAEQLNKAAPNRNDDWNSGSNPPYDPAIHEAILGMQMNSIATLLHRNRMKRMINARLRQSDPYSVAEMFESTGDAVYASLGNRSINGYDRNLQIAYADFLGATMNNLRPSPATPSAPEEARALARLELSELASDVESAIGGSNQDRVTRAHLLELQARVAATFEVGATKEVR